MAGPGLGSRDRADLGLCLGVRPECPRQNRLHFSARTGCGHRDRHRVFRVGGMASIEL